MTSFRFLLRFCPGRMAGVADPTELRRGSGILTDPDFSCSRAMVFVDSGGSFMWEASVGKDQRDGAGLKIIDGVWTRLLGRYCEVLALSREVLVRAASEERLKEDEVLGRGREPSSTTLSEADWKWLMMPAGLNLHVETDGDDESSETSEVVSPLERCEKIVFVKLEVRVCAAGRWKIEERTGLGSRTVVVVVEVEMRRFWVRVLAKFRSGWGVVKVIAPCRFLRGVGGEVERSTTACPRCALSERRASPSTKTKPSSSITASSPSREGRCTASSGAARHCWPSGATTGAGMASNAPSADSPAE